MKQAQGTWVSPEGIPRLGRLAFEVGALGVQPGDNPPSHWLAQERLAIHTHEDLCSKEMRPHIKKIRSHLSTVHAAS